MSYAQEQIPLQMSLPNAHQNKQVKWIPLSSNGQDVSPKSTPIPAKTIDESIKNQIQKKMHSLLKPLDDETQQP